MNIEDLGNQISEYECQIVALGTKMENVKNKIVVEIETYLKETYIKDIEYQVKSKTDITKQLGVEKLSELKQELTQLLDRVSGLTKESFNKDSLWIHKNYDIKEKDEFGIMYNSKQNIKTNITKTIRELMGHGGRLIIKYGYENYSNNTCWEKIQNSDIPKYSYSIMLNDGIEEVMKEYTALFEQLHDCHVKLLKAKKDKAQQEALDLWSQA